MKTRWLFLLAGCALFAACQRPAPSTPASGSGPAATGEGGATPAPAEVPAAPANNPVSAAGEGESPVAKMASELAAYQQKIQEWSVKVRAANESEREALIEQRPKADETARAIRALLPELTDDGDRFTALEFVARNLVDQPEQVEALAELVEKHQDNAGFPSFFPAIAKYLPDGAATLESFYKSDKPWEFRFAALTSLAKALESTDAQKAETLLASAIEEHGEEIVARGRKLKDIVEPMLYILQHLSIGKTAPEIEGNDFEEVAFKLSDYRGKVVVLDFWGDW